MKNDNATPLTADADRGEVVLTLDGQPVLVRFGLKFLAALTDHEAAAGPSDLLDRLATAPVGALLKMAEMGIRLSKHAAMLPEGFDVLEAIEEMPVAEQKNLFKVLFASVSRNPIMEVLTQANPS